MVDVYALSETIGSTLPAGWATTTLSKICDVITDGTHHTPRYVLNGVPFFSVENVTADDFQHVKHISEEEHRKLIKRCRPQRGDILMTRIGSLADTKLIDWDVEASIYVSLALLRPSRRIDPAYLYAYTKSERFVRDVEDRSLLWAAPKKINMGDIGRVPISFPIDPGEQAAISDAILDTEQQIRAVMRLITKKQAIRQGMMQQLLTGKSDLSGLATWSQFRVADIITVRFSGPSPTCEERNVRGQEWGVLKTTCSTWERGWDPAQHKVLPESFWGNPRLEIQVGDSIITKAGPRHRVGVPAYVSSIGPHVIPSGKMICLRPDKRKILPGFLVLALSDRRTQAYLDQRTTGMAESQVNFENRDLLGAPVWLPEIPIQRRLLEPLEDMQGQITTLKDRLGKARSIKQGIMQELLSGRTRLPVKERAA